MANTKYITENRLTTESKNIQSSRRKIALYVGIPVVAVGFLYNQGLGWLMLVFFILLILTQGGDKIIEAGAEGEDYALKLLKRLPDSYTILNQVDVPSARSRTGVVEADLVVCGPNAVFVVEVKHNNGEIECDEGNAKWRVIKTGRGGTRYEKEMRNPIKQVKNLVWLLGDYLKERRAKPWIQGLVVFTNANASLSKAGYSSIPILAADEMVPYMLNFSPDASSSVKNKTVHAIASLKA